MSKLLKNIPNLGMNPNNICVIALKCLSNVVEACFRTEVSDNYSQAMLLFEEAYKFTGLSCTVKIHCLCRHVRTFIEDFLPKGAGLVQYLNKRSRAPIRGLKEFGRDNTNVINIALSTLRIFT